MAEKVVWPAFGCAQHPKAGRNTQHPPCALISYQVTGSSLVPSEQQSDLDPQYFELLTNRCDLSQFPASTSSAGQSNQSWGCLTILTWRLQLFPLLSEKNLSGKIILYNGMLHHSFGWELHIF